MRIFDINLRQRFWSRDVIQESLGLADVLKLNDEELPVLARLFDLGGAPAEQLGQLAERFDLDVVALTRGAQGSMLWVRGEVVSRPGSTLVIADTVGAGDSYTAALAFGLLRGLTPAQIVERAHRLADYVCTQPGAMPPVPAELRAAFKPSEKQ